MCEHKVDSNILKKVSTVAYLIGLVAAVFAGASVFFFNNGDETLHFEEVKSDATTGFSRKDDILIKRMVEIENQLSEVLKALNDKSDKLSGQNAIVLRLNNIEYEVESINSAIMNAPERALAIPILKKDLIVLQKEIDDLNVRLKEDLKDVRVDFRWSIATIVVSVVGLAIGYISHFVERIK